MARKKFGVSTGRPKASPAMKMPKPGKGPMGIKMPSPDGASPMDSFRPSVPASAFKSRGRVSYHDDPVYRGSKNR